MFILLKALVAGVVVDAEDTSGDTPFNLAVSRGHHLVIQVNKSEIYTNKKTAEFLFPCGLKNVEMILHRRNGFTVQMHWTCDCFSAMYM